MVAPNLPTPLTPFVGRSRELVEIIDLINNPSCRLLTLVGTGGMGKTRLALQAAALLQPNNIAIGMTDNSHSRAKIFPEGIYLVPLQPLTSPDFILSAIAEAVGMRFYPGDEPLLQLIDYLCLKSSLLILDNFEHLLDGAEIASQLLAGASNIKILVTSRETLNLHEEWLYPVKGMHFPRNADDSLETYSAVQLFLQCAQRADPNFSLAGAQHEVFRICQLVEGLPLALEMTAAWLKRLPCREIVGHLGHGLDILESTARNVPVRHRSMRAVFEGSWNLLTEAEQAIFMKLSVFRGGFSKEAAEAVSGSSLNVLSILIDKSLLRIDGGGRYDLHELLRQYAGEQLEALPEANKQARAAHSTWYIAFLEQRESAIINDAAQDAAMEIDQDLKNIESAWEWAMAQHFFDKIFTAGRCLLIFYQNRSLSRQAEAIFAKDLAILRKEPPSIFQAASILGLGWCVQTGSYQYDKARMLLEEGLSLSRQFNSPLLIHFALLRLSELAVQLGNYEEAKQLAEEDLLTLRQADLTWQQTYTLSHLGNIRRLSGDFKQAKTLLQQAADVAKKYGIATGLAIAQNYLGQVELALQAYADAARTFTANLARQRTIDHRQGELDCLIGLAEAARGLGTLSKSRRYFTEALQMAIELHEIPMVLDALTAATQLLILEGNEETALQVLALVQDHRVTTYNTRNRAQQLLIELEPHMSVPAVTAALVQAKTRQIEEVIQVLLANELSVQPELGRPEYQEVNQQVLEALTVRELEIVRLIDSGLSNEEIAKRLVVGVSTVKKHINHLYAKLDVVSRTQAVRRAREMHLL